MLDLARALSRAGHDVVVMVPGSELGAPWQLEKIDGFQVLRLRSPRTKDLPYARRLVAEWLMPFSMYRNWRRSPLRKLKFDGVAFYSPSIFHSRLVKAIMRKHGARSYLILRDIFPDWALDMGLMRPGAAYSLLKGVAKRQYRTADVIGIQSPGNLGLINADDVRPDARIEVLHNWLEPRKDRGCAIDLSKSKLRGRRICVYAGNIGVAQKLDVIVDVAERLRSQSGVGFVLVGRGNDTTRIASEIMSRSLDNILMYDEIDHDEIPGLYSQADVGLVVLDERHRTHNIPGKFVSYMHSGLPVLAIVNPKNDLIEIIQTAHVGVAHCERNADVIAADLLKLLDQIATGEPIQARCKALAVNLFSAERAAAQITQGLQG